MNDQLAKGLRAQQEAREAIAGLADSMDRFEKVRKDYAPLADLLDEACRRSGVDKRATVELALRQYVEAPTAVSRETVSEERRAIAEQLSSIFENEDDHPTDPGSPGPFSVTLSREEFFVIAKGLKRLLGDR